VLDGYPALNEVVWLQEEPENMGAWEFYRPLLDALAADRARPRYIGRPRSASPSEGSAAWHTLNQRAIVEEAFAAAPVAAPAPARSPSRRPNRRQGVLASANIVVPSSVSRSSRPASPAGSSSRARPSPPASRSWNSRPRRSTSRSGAEQHGVLAEITRQEGEDVKVGEVLGVIRSGRRRARPLDAPAELPASATASAGATRERPRHGVAARSRPRGDGSARHHRAQGGRRSTPWTSPRWPRAARPGAS
jgi:hypothetical protein